MTAASPAVLGIPPRTLILVFAAMAGLFAFTTGLSHWYAGQRLARAQVYFAAGTRLAAQGKLDRAIEAFRNALAISRGNPRYRFAIADSLMKLGRLDEAAIYFHELLEADPGDGAVNLMLARIAARRGRADSAVNYYQRAIFGHWSSDTEPSRATARWELVALLARTGSKKQVVAELLEIADQSPNDLPGIKRVARMLLDYGSPRQAAEVYREALRINPRDAEAQAGVGQADLGIGDYEAAESAFRRALRDDPHSAPAHQGLALVDQVLALDPAVRGIGAAERQRRSRALLQRSVTALDRCLAASPSPPRSGQQLLAAARKALAPPRRRARPSAADADRDLALAGQVWSARQSACGPASSPDPLLARVMARLSR